MHVDFFNVMTRVYKHRLPTACLRKLRKARVFAKVPGPAPCDVAVGSRNRADDLGYALVRHGRAIVHVVVRRERMPCALHAAALFLPIPIQWFAAAT